MHSSLLWLYSICPHCGYIHLPLHAYLQLSLPPSCTHSAKIDPTLCRRVMFDGGLQSLSSAMKAFHWDSGLQVAAISALAVALASGKKQVCAKGVCAKGVCAECYCEPAVYIWCVYSCVCTHTVFRRLSTIYIWVWDCAPAVHMLCEYFVQWSFSPHLCADYGLPAHLPMQFQTAGCMYSQSMFPSWTLCSPQLIAFSAVL